MSSAPANPITVGRVGRAHGLDGSFYVTQPIVRLLAAGARVILAGQAEQIVRRAGTDARPIVRLGGIDSREQAQAARGEPLLLDTADAPSLGADEYWSGELEGCSVRDGELEVGRVLRLMALPSCEVLEVSRPDGTVLLVPMVKDAIRRIDPRARLIDVNMHFLGAS